MPGSPTDGEGSAPVAVAASDYLWFVDLALDEMAAIVEELGDDLANRRPPFRDTNSAYVILTHCLGVMEYWGGATVAERPVQRDRAAEFTASGDVAGLLRRTERGPPPAARGHRRARRRRPRRPTCGATPTTPCPTPRRKGAVLLHVLEELFQHLGQMELTRDALGGGGSARDARATRPCRSPAASTPAALGGAGRGVAGARRLVGHGRSRPAPRRCASCCATPTPPCTAAAALANARRQCCPFFDVSIDARGQTGARSSWPCPTVPRRCWPPSWPCSPPDAAQTMKGASPPASMPRSAMRPGHDRGRRSGRRRASCCRTATTRWAASTSK